MTTKGKRDFTKERSIQYANSIAMFSPSHRHWEKTLVCLFPLSLPVPSLFPTTGLSPVTSSHQLPPTWEKNQRLLLLAMTPVSTEAWLHGAFEASFLPSPLPVLTPTPVKHCICQFTPKKSQYWNNDPGDASSLIKFLTGLSLQLTRELYESLKCTHDTHDNATSALQGMGPFLCFNVYF